MGARRYLFGGPEFIGPDVNGKGVTALQGACVPIEIRIRSVFGAAPIDARGIGL